MRLLLTLPLLLAAVAVADAGSCRVIKQVAAPVAVQQILVPSYGGSYGGAAPQQQNDDVLRRLVEVLERLESRLDTPPGGHTVESITKQSCAKCHTEGSARGGFIMFDGEGTPLELSLGDKKLVRLRITTQDVKQRMPPERALPPAQQQIIVEALKQ